jgi:hypothetical protein
VALHRPVAKPPVAGGQGAKRPFAPLQFPARELDPRPPTRPQPRWLLWVRRFLLTSATKTEPEHTEPTTEPRLKPAFACLSTSGGRPPLVASSMGPKPKPRGDTSRGATHTGRELPSQHARSGAEAHSKEPEHPTVAASFPADLESPPGRGSGRGSPPDPSRERLQSLREPRCFALSGHLAGELLP